MMKLKPILISIAIIVTILFISSCQLNQIKDIGENIGGNIQNTEESKCRVWAESLVPGYLIFGPDWEMKQDMDSFNIYNVYPVTSKWKDGKSFDDNYQRMPISGSSEGQNINLHYRDLQFKRSEQVISKEGEILGTNSFYFKPHIFRLVNVNIYTSLEDDGWIPAGEEIEISVSWSGLLDALEVLDIDSLKLFMTEEKMNADSIDTIFNFLTDDDEGVYSIKYIFDVGSTTIISSEPELIGERLFEIVEYDIIDCSWVDD
ncbi:hypothetical protein GOV09_01210 [Candidatus Woesearchaeota archaeon]|nr:hypothetical protein [Candidatus Woesearchaeota archaeon]